MSGEWPEQLDRSGAVPLHRQLADELRRAIDQGRYAPGDQLPSEHELSRLHGVARGTVRQALAALRRDGAIVARRGARCVVLPPAQTQSFTELRGFSAWARSIGETPGGRVVELARRPARNDEAVALGIGEAAAVYRLVRVRLLSGSPVMVERSVFPERVGTLVAALDLDRESISECLAAYGMGFARANHVIDAVPAGSLDARLLDLPRRTPLLRDRRRSTSQQGEILEWSDDRYRGDAMAFMVANTASASSVGRLLPSPTTPSRHDHRLAS